MHLQAARDLHQGEELTLDYGDRPLRDMLRSYAFVPEDACCEVGSTLLGGVACSMLVTFCARSGHSVPCSLARMGLLGYLLVVISSMTDSAVVAHTAARCMPYLLERPSVHHSGAAVRRCMRTSDTEWL